jgi:hypothetical protein
MTGFANVQPKTHSERYESRQFIAENQKSS